jgi:hypothetical protein
VPRITPPSIPAVIFTLLLLLVPVGLQTPLLNSDGDLARHLRHGRYMIEHRALIRQDPFSFSRAGAPFVAFEYGSQLIYGLADKLGGVASVALLAGLLIGATYALLATLLLAMKVDPLLAYATVALAAVLGIGHWTARPHLFSYVAIVLLLMLVERRPRRCVVLTGFLFVLWVNIHGGFIYGLILIGLYASGSAVEALLRREEREAWKNRTAEYLKMLAVALAATVVNPYGLELHRHLFIFLGQGYLFDNTAEFTSPDFHAADGKIFLAVLLLSLVSLILSRRRPTIPRLFVICAGVAFALQAVRNVPIFGLTALPLVALHLDAEWKSVTYGAEIRRRFALVSARASTWPWVALALAMAGVLGISRGRLGSSQIITNDFDPTIFPVAAVRHARSSGLKGRLFTEFAWGGYVIYAWPEQKVFIDGGTDFYGPELLREYATIKRLVPGWRKLLSKWNFSVLLLKRESSLAHEVARDPTWQIFSCDSLAVLMRRLPVSTTTLSASADSSEARLESCNPDSKAKISGPARHTDQ